jgi:FKBP-type peptidyl-prolyl cis-trans isomerase FklB
MGRYARANPGAAAAGSCLGLALRRSQRPRYCLCCTSPLFPFNYRGCIVRTRPIVALLACLLAAEVFAAEGTVLSTDKQKFSYTLGYQFGQRLAHSGAELDPKAVAQAIDDALVGKPARLSQEQMQAAVKTYQQAMQKKRLAEAEQNKKAGDEFLAANKKKEGWKVLPSGVQYKVLKEGSGPQPKADSTVVVNYRGTLIDGKEFDSSYQRGEPATLKVNQVIKGWQEVLPLMKTGAKWEVVVPPDLAYGPRGAGGLIGPNATLVFTIDLLEVKETK